MLDLWGLVNRRSSMVVVVGRYPTIPLEMFSGIVYGPPTDSEKPSGQLLGLIVMSH
jgi:hypothetical protein